ncbi:DgyrCDS14658 [Dimorphilus gyrociliatus]|uniref:DgyrCDS14658 n=1 Tax=Dimorphilus gyrociliatus TaxID=2664684 RepID=A0A7I8WED5_9ANNE|nr:DgyrCDS14658 [Dimorphilus gyrociliatus]
MATAIGWLDNEKSGKENPIDSPLPNITGDEANSSFGYSKCRDITLPNLVLASQLLMSYIPAMLALFLNIAIIYTLYKSDKARKSMTEEESKQSKRSARTTKLILVVSFAFVILVGPPRVFIVIGLIIDKFPNSANFRKISIDMRFARQFGFVIGRKRKQTTSEYLMAGRDMSILPVALSLLASFMSAITLLGTPAEIYKFGTIYWWIWISYLLLIPVAAHVYLPVFFRLRVTSVFEYLEMRFNKATRLIGAIIFSVQMILYMAIVLYAPSLALNQVTGLNTWISVFAVGVVCTFYTTIGGMKAVMWTDSFQIITMFAGLIAILVKGSLDFGGFGNIWRINEEGGRVEFKDFDPDPMKRHTFWTLSIGGMFTWLAIYGVNQSQVQRALCVPKLRDAQIALWLNLPGLTALLTVCGLCGMVIYAQYADCDPLTLGLAEKSDQLVPLYVMHKLGDYPGLPGLFTACLFSGALSTISSGLNSLSAVLLQDVLRETCLKGMTEGRATLYAKLLVVLYGALCIGLTFVAAQLGDVLQAALGLFGMLGGPVLAVFTCGIIYPCINKHGAVCGLVTSLGVTLWCGIGAQIDKPLSKTLPMNISGCELDSSLNNQTLYTTVVYETTTNAYVSPTKSPYQRHGFNHFHDLSYLYYGVLASIVCTIVALVVSWITGSTKREDLDPKLIMPITDIFCCFCPSNTLAWCRCFIPLYKPTREDYIVEKPKEDSAHEISKIDDTIVTLPSTDSKKSGMDNGAYDSTELEEVEFSAKL